MDCMEAEHIEHKQLLARLKVAMVRQDAAAVARSALALVEEYRSHIAKEEDILYPMARQGLTDPEQLQIMTREMHARRQEAGLIGC